jgi:hypothetical protein
MGIRRVLVATLAGASVLAAGAPGTALADPAPSPAHTRQARVVKAHADRARHVRRARHRPRTVVRCQSEGTDQIDEIDDESDEPRHYVSPDTPAPAGTCPGLQEALGIANVLGGGARRARTARQAPQRTYLRSPRSERAVRAVR